MSKKIYAIVGVVLTVLHLVVYSFMKYYWLYFLLGFGAIYLIFVLPMKNRK